MAGKTIITRAHSLEQGRNETRRIEGASPAAAPGPLMAPRLPIGARCLAGPPTLGRGDPELKVEGRRRPGGPAAKASPKAPREALQTHARPESIAGVRASRGGCFN